MVKIRHHSSLPENNPHSIFPPPPPKNAPVTPSRTIRLILVGDARVGKTSLLKRFTQHTFSTTSNGQNQDEGELLYTPTIGSDYCKMDFQPNNEVCIRLQIWDTAGDEKFRYVTGECLRQTQPDGIVLVCTYPSDHKCRDLEENAHRWKNFIEQFSNQNRQTPIALFANKVDQLGDQASSHGVCQVVEAGKRIEELCHKLNVISWFLTSAKEDTNVSEGFHTLLKNVLLSQGVHFGISASNRNHSG